MDNLKPCPFCGGIPEVFPLGRDFAATFWVNCRCGARIERPPGAGEWKKKDAIEAWNKRFNVNREIYKVIEKVSSAECSSMKVDNCTMKR